MQEREESRRNGSHTVELRYGSAVECGTDVDVDVDVERGHWKLKLKTN